MSVNFNSEPSVVLTRYLYIKNEVKVALLTSLLERNEEKSLFWAYELYYSGFEKDLLESIWNTYFDCYCPLNPTFATFLRENLEKLEKSKNTEEKREIISLIINNFLIRPYSLDIFLLVKKSNENDKFSTKMTLTSLLNERNYAELSKYILQTPENKLKTLMEKIVEYFEKTNENIKKSEEMQKFEETYKKTKKIITPQKIVLSLTFSLYNQNQKVKMGKNIILNLNVDEIETLKKYDTIISTKELPPYKVLPRAYSYQIDANNYLSLLGVRREQAETMNIYCYSWLYYASFSPIWSERIKKYGGKIIHERQTVEFQEDPDDDLMQEFYGQFGYEPDEQSRETQEKSIQPVTTTTTWENFYETFGKRGIYIPQF
jgi:hypothetical protein